MTNIDLHCGTLSIDPVEPLQMFGHSGSCDPAPPPSEQQPRIEANWIAFHETDGIFILIGIDSLFSSDVFERHIMEQLSDLPVIPSIMVVASHTHLAPALDPTKPILGVCSISHLVRIATNIANDIMHRLTKLPRHARQSLSFGSSNAAGSVYRRRFGIAINRRPPFIRLGIHSLPNENKLIPQNLRIWTLSSMDGRTSTALVSWPCHPVSRVNTASVSADYITVIRDTLRDTFSTRLPVIFFPGASGDIRPNYRRGRKSIFYPYPFQSNFPMSTPERELDFDLELARSTKAAVASLRPLVECPDNTPSNSGVKFVKRYINLNSFVKETGDGKLSISALRLSNLTILALGAEPSMNWIKALGWNDNDAYYLLTGYTGQIIGYLPTDAQIGNGGYEVDRFRKSFNFKGCYSTEKPVDLVILAEIRAALRSIEK